MAIQHLPMAPLVRPVTVGDCRDGPRPCPWLSCRHNLLLDVLEDGAIVLNAPSKRLEGAERTIPDAHDVERFWYVEVRLPARQAKNDTDGSEAIFALGPLDDAERAKAIAAAWEVACGPRPKRDQTPRARAYRKIPDSLVRVGPTRSGAIDAKFEDEAEDAVEQWFDEPNPTRPSCVLDEVAKVDRDDGDDDGGHLLEQIAKVMYVSRERVRQVESAATLKLDTELRKAGFSVNDLHGED